MTTDLGKENASIHCTAEVWLDRSTPVREELRVNQLQTPQQIQNTIAHICSLTQEFGNKDYSQLMKLLATDMA